MVDDKSKRGKPDRDKVAGGEKYEIDYLRKTTGASATEIAAAIAKVGNSRTKIEAELKKRKQK